MVTRTHIFLLVLRQTLQLGAGPGTALVMSLLVVIGTLLPLIEDHADDAASPAAVVTILGLVFAISGFVTSGENRHALRAVIKQTICRRYWLSPTV